MVIIAAMPLRQTAILLLGTSYFFLLIRKSQSQGAPFLSVPAVNCTCNMTNSRCDENEVCRCDPGWEGERCQVCVRMPGCVHGSCHQPWQCTCDPGWAGRFCDKDIHVCSKEEPCQNGATCFINDSGEYSCLCPEGFHGRNCELKTGPCHKTRSPCKNGGLCEDAGGYAPELSCRCLAGFAGRRCEADVDDCLMRPCANGATCLDGVNRFSCLCPEGFAGRFCTVNLDDCASRPCANGGRCLDRAGTFHCLCQPGYAGRTCEVALAGEGPDYHAPIRSSPGWAGGGGGQGRVTPRQPARGNGSQGAAGGGDRLFKISVKEVVTGRGPAGLSEVQLVTLLVLGGMTAAVVVLTACLVLRGRWPGGRWPGGCARCPSGPPSRLHRRPPPPAHRVAGEQESKISFLHTPSGPELEKKKLNTEVI